MRAQSQSLSPMSQDAQQDDGNGTAFPPWPQSGPFDGNSPIPSNASVNPTTNANATSSYDSSPAFDYTLSPSTTFDLVAKNGRALSVGTARLQLQQQNQGMFLQKRASLEFDDSSWDAQSSVA